MCMQEGYAAQVATTQAELAASRQETLTVREQADLSVREAVMSADKKVHRLTERTAKVTTSALYGHQVLTTSEA